MEAEDSWTLKFIFFCLKLIINSNVLLLFNMLLSLSIETYNYYCYQLKKILLFLFGSVLFLQLRVCYYTVT